MAKRLKAETLSGDLAAELLAKAGEIRRRYGPEIGWKQIQQILVDPQITPFPCEICFDANPLLPGEFAHTAPKSESEGSRFVIYLHPRYASQPGRIPYLVLHQLATVYYAGRATVDDAETFGALVLGLSKEAYFQALCDLSGQMDDAARD